MIQRPKSILFVCSENALRSPMAEGPRILELTIRVVMRGKQ